MAMLDVLAQSGVLSQNNFGDTRSGGLAGPMGLFIVVLLAVATVLLIRNMNARIRRLPDRFTDVDEVAGPSAADTAPAAAPASADNPSQPGSRAT